MWGEKLLSLEGIDFVWAGVLFTSNERLSTLRLDEALFVGRVTFIPDMIVVTWYPSYFL